MITCKSIKSTFSQLHVNARSLSQNLNLITPYLSSLKHKCSIIAVSETWATANNISLINISGYHSAFINRPGTRGGVVLFIHDDFAYSERDDCNVYINFNLKSPFFVEVTFNDDCKHITGNSRFSYHFVILAVCLSRASY